MNFFWVLLSTDHWPIYLNKIYLEMALYVLSGRFILCCFIIYWNQFEGDKNLINDKVIKIFSIAESNNNDFSEAYLLLK